MILARLQDGETLLGLVRAWKLPRHAFLSWIAANGELTDQCRRVRELAGIELRMEGLEIVDVATPETAPVAKLQADYREKLSRDLNKPLFGKYTQHEHRHTFDLGERLRRARDRAEGVIDTEVVPAIEVKQEPAVEAAPDAVRTPPI